MMAGGYRAARRWRRPLVALLAVVAMATGAHGQSPEVEARALSQNLMSPYCPGLLLADCRSEGARLLRVEIEQRLTAGDTAAAVEADLVRRFGPAIRTMPDFSGVGLVAWMGPLVFGLAGLGFAIVAIRSFTRPATGDGENGTDDDGEDAGVAHRIRDELDSLD